MVSRYKITTTFSIDEEVIKSFKKFCPAGEMSSTVEELLRQYLDKVGASTKSLEDALKEKQANLDAVQADVNALKNRVESIKILRDAQESERVVALERASSFSSLNEETKAQAKMDVLVEMGLSFDERVPRERHDEFVFRWKKRHEELLIKAKEKE